MQVTPFGWVFMPLLLAVAIWARPWLLGLVLGSAVFQAAAVVNVPIGTGFYGISPYMASVGVASIALLWRRFGPENSPVRPPAHVRTPAIWLLIYAAIALAGSFVLPHLFAGLPVQPPLDPKGYSLERLPPLAWSISNLAQAVNLCAHLLVAFYAWQAMGRKDWSASKTLKVFAIASGLAVAAGLHDRLALLTDWPRAASFWMSNAGYAMSDLGDVRWVNPTLETGAVNHILTYSRISSPFSEPSYGSAFLAALLTGLTSLALFAQSNLALIAIAIAIVLACLISTLGSTGFLAALIAVAANFFWFGAKKIKAQTPRSHNQKISATTITLLITLAAAICAIFVASKDKHFSTAAHYMFIEKFRTLEHNARFHSDMNGFKLAIRSVGLGVGMGSTRTSSLISSLLSNTGIAGTLAFLMMAGSLAWQYIRCNKLFGAHYFAASAMGAGLLASFIGLPDLNLPFLWAFIVLAFTLCPDVGTTPPAKSVCT